MVKTPTIHDIKERFEEGHSITQIARDLGLDRKTVRKYTNMEDFSPKVPVKRTRASLLDPHREYVDEILEADRYVRRKQRHTARRIYERLVEERDFEGSYNIVQRYVKAWHEKAATAGNPPTGEGFMPLTWPAGTAQADFGEADFILDGEQQTMKFFVLSFPFSNVGFVQVFGGETAECVCQGLKDVANYIGGMPAKIVFDNASGVGRKIMGAVQETELFHNFRLHYDFDIRLCNPDSGHEKGNVERKVHTLRSKLFVPVPIIPDNDLLAYNSGLLNEVERWNNQKHYQKGTNQLQLFEEDLKALRPLPSHSFDVRRYVERKTDKYGCVQIDGRHAYSVSPMMQRVRVIVGVGAHDVTVHSTDGALIITHPRIFGPRNTRISDPASLLPVLRRNPGSWEQCPVRQVVTPVMQQYMDAGSSSVRRTAIQVLTEVTNQYGFDTAQKAFSAGIERGRTEIEAVMLLAARIASGGIDTVPEPGPSLAAYDELLHDNLKEA